MCKLLYVKGSDLCAILSHNLRLFHCSMDTIDKTISCQLVVAEKAYILALAMEHLDSTDNVAMRTCISMQMIRTAIKYDFFRHSKNNFRSLHSTNHQKTSRSHHE